VDPPSPDVNGAGHTIGEGAKLVFLSLSRRAARRARQRGRSGGAGVHQAGAEKSARPAA